MFAVLVVLALAALAVGWYATRTYFVGADEGAVVIYRGRPGGVLWFDPGVAEATDLLNGKTISAKQSADSPLAALVFKTIVDPYGKISYVRVYGGTLAANSTVYNPRTRKDERIGYKRSRKFLRRHALGVGTAALVLLLISASAVALALQSSVSPTARQSRHPRPPYEASPRLGSPAPPTASSGRDLEHPPGTVNTK